MIETIDTENIVSCCLIQSFKTIPKNVVKLDSVKLDK